MKIKVDKIRNEERPSTSRKANKQTLCKKKKKTLLPKSVKKMGKQILPKMQQNRNDNFTSCVTIKQKTNKSFKDIRKFLNPVQVDILSDDEHEMNPINSLDDFLKSNKANMKDAHLMRVESYFALDNYLKNTYEGRVERETRRHIYESLYQKGIPQDKFDKIRKFIEEFIQDSSDSESEEEIKVKKKPQPFIKYSERNVICSDYYAIHTKEGKLLFLRENCKIYMAGLANVSVIYGQVNIYGKHLNKTHKPLDLYSPECMSYVFIENMNRRDDLPPMECIRRVVALGLNKETAFEALFKQFSRKCAIVLCRKLDTAMTRLTDAQLSVPLYPKEENGLRATFTHLPFQGWDVLQFSEEWQQFAHCIDASSKILLTGGKGVGKSTLFRYLINSALNRFDAVCVIDLDPGQVEFTVPGCVSLHIIKQPLLGPNFTHYHKPETAIYTGNFDIAIDPPYYLNAVSELMRRSEQFAEDIPTLINYHGFIHDLGEHLIASTIAIVKPRTVVQIVKDERNFAIDLQCENISAYVDLLTPQYTHLAVEYELVKLPSLMTDFLGRVVLRPRELRELSIFNYFSRMIPEQCTHITQKEVPIYKINLSDIQIMYGDVECDPSIANASLVALCTKTDALYEVHGWGIVRGISIEQNMLYLLTPESPDTLEMIDYLVVGNVTLPPAFLFNHDKNIRGVIPYVHYGEWTGFAKTPTSNKEHWTKMDN